MREDNLVLNALIDMLQKQADAMESAGVATAAEIRAMNNRLTVVVVLALALNTAIVASAVSLRFGRAQLQVDGLDTTQAANLITDQVPGHPPQPTAPVPSRPLAPAPSRTSPGGTRADH